MNKSGIYTLVMSWHAAVSRHIASVSMLRSMRAGVRRTGSALDCRRRRKHPITRRDHQRHRRHWSIGRRRHASTVSTHTHRL
jgi:hypothetical protein